MKSREIFSAFYIVNILSIQDVGNIISDNGTEVFP
ncbi:hypothetical protein CHRY9293_02308 [Chryseobacterium potabilaquae]|uniref:Uncharacterized protein n=1 Tax=Chryseobacterium potabilaquae TaxID=2675057 RepID=A0A6N4X5A2_9FLAO|nr:hypothetical protein CHRY9293_02308 [Chryseobacterium potabilaquae]